MSSNSIPPSIGRKVWYWSGNVDDKQVRADQQAFDADIVFVHADGDISVALRDHYGVQYADSHLKLRDPTGDERHGHGGDAFCTWMPYQVGQSKKKEA